MKIDIYETENQPIEQSYMKTQYAITVNEFALANQLSSEMYMIIKSNASVIYNSILSMILAAMEKNNYLYEESKKNVLSVLNVTESLSNKLMNNKKDLQ